MNHAADLPIWAALLVAAFLILGAGLTLLGSFGLVRLRNFYDRIHAPTLGVSGGTAGIVIASVILFTVLRVAAGRPRDPDRHLRDGNHAGDPDAARPRRALP